MPSSLSADDQEHTALGWRLIEWKVAYYKPEVIHSSRLGDYEVSDEVYDAAEVRYLTLCRKLGLSNTVVHKGWPGFEDLVGPHTMMEVDETRPSVQLVMAKLGSIKSRRRKSKGKS
jgi:hypothetical protein